MGALRVKRGHGNSTTSEQNHENMPSTKDQTKKLQPEGSQTGVFALCSFEDLGLHPTLCQQLQERMGFKVPTLIQAESIPLIISGRHVLVNAATGTGKTIAYLAPIIHHLQLYLPKIKRPDGTFALVLVPTRELCMQVYEILQKLLHRFHWIVPGYIMGGENRSKEKGRLRKGITILVATPGRLLDHLKNTSSFSYSNLRWIIFDEADRILELGFGKEIEEILSLLGSGQNGFIGKESKFPRQNLLLSATLNEKVNDLAKISLENPVMIGLEDKKIFTKVPCLSGRDFSTVGSDSNLESKNSSVGDYKLPAQLVQRYVKVTYGSRLVVLLSILRSLFEREVSQKIVVFFSTCDAVDFHYSLCSEFRCSSDLQAGPEENQIFIKWRTFRLHGSMEQDDRRKMFQGFNAEKSAILLCTDVAARGLDFPKVQYIIQYDSPGDAIEYVHRVGRTARLGKKGDALLFLQPVEIDYLQELKKHGVPLEEFPLHKLLDNFALRDLKHLKKKLVALEMHPWLVYLQRGLELFVSTESTIKQMAKKAFLSWVRAYTAHRGELKRIFMVKKLHLGHVARSFGLKEQPSSVGGSFQALVKKRKRDQKRGSVLKRRKITKKA